MQHLPMQAAPGITGSVPVHACAQQRRDSDETGSAKKQRVVWNQEMHQQFVEAVQTLGVESKP